MIKPAATDEDVPVEIEPAEIGDETAFESAPPAAEAAADEADEGQDEAASASPDHDADEAGSATAPASDVDVHPAARPDASRPPAPASPGR